MLYGEGGSKIYGGENVGGGGDDRLLGKMEGVVGLEGKGREKKEVCVYGVGE
ncbi:hypothetical protein [Staphylococcus hominis]|uniref:hypothetical protein n=1 Tax=Staphylococcus hominis TaxID=1290 RepID=UPI003709C0B7